MIPPRIVVADNQINREVPFWRQSIGRKGVLLSIDSDGLWDVLLDGDPLDVRGAFPGRFEKVSWPLRARISAKLRAAWAWLMAPVK